MAVDVERPAGVVPPVPPRRWWVWWAAAVVLVIAVLISGDRVHSWWHNRSPYPPAAVHPHLVGLQVMTPSDGASSNVVAALHALGDRGLAADVPVAGAHRHWQYVVGRIDVSAHPVPSGGELDLIVIDNRTHQLPAIIFGDPKHDTGGGAGAGAGYDPGVANLGRKFPWLRAVLPVQSEDGDYTDPGLVVGFPAGPARSLPFVAVLPTDAPPVTNQHSDITVALALTGPDGQPYWAERLN